jgi:hypothetical protein
MGMERIPGKEKESTVEEQRISGCRKDLESMEVFH